MPGNAPDFSHWSDEEVEKLLRLIESGSSLADLARALGRSESDLERETRFLSVQIPQHGPLSTRTADSSAMTATIHCVPVNPERRT